MNSQHAEAWRAGACAQRRRNGRRRGRRHRVAGEPEAGPLRTCARATGAGSSAIGRLVSGDICWVARGRRSLAMADGARAGRVGELATRGLSAALLGVQRSDAQGTVGL